jgi:predicted nucleic-acid-binding protein
MIGLDTNVLARFLLDDDPRQSALAKKALQGVLSSGQRLMICSAMFLELEWVLRSRPDLNKASVVAMLRQLFELHDLMIDDEAAVEEALQTYENANVDFAECLFYATCRRRGCGTMMTFDKAAQKHFAGCVAPA